jgi:hypothetical protein
VAATAARLAVTTAGKAGEAGAFVAEASPRRFPRSQRRRRPRRCLYQSRRWDLKENWFLLFSN